jgi:hypothetical protein
MAMQGIHIVQVEPVPGVSLPAWLIGCVLWGEVQSVQG